MNTPPLQSILLDIVIHDVEKMVKGIRCRMFIFIALSQATSPLSNNTHIRQLKISKLDPMVEAKIIQGELQVTMLHYSASFNCSPLIL